MERLDGGGLVALRDRLKNPWGRREARSSALVSALADIERLIRERPELSKLGRTLAGLLEAAFAGPIPEPRWDVEPYLLVSAWQQGVPVFRAGESPPEIDRDDLRTRALAICEVLCEENPQARALREAIRRGRFDVSSWALAELTDPSEPLGNATEAIGVDLVLARSVVRLALMPVLSRLSERLASIRPEGIWERGHCPNCGNAPTLAESRGLEQGRRWRCGLCAADWAGQRLRCPLCDETDHRRLHYRFAEGEPDRYRLGLCDSCGGSLLVVATLSPLSSPGLLVAELATAHLLG
jgi:FdhE protein